MADIFGRQEQVYAGGLTSDASWMFWAGMASGGLGMLITQMSIQYSQPIRRIFEIGPWTSVGSMVGQPVYYVAGRPEGSLQLGRIAGPVAVLGGFYKNYGNICNHLNSLMFVSSTGCLTGGAGATPSPGVPTLGAGAAPFPGTPGGPGVVDRISAVGTFGAATRLDPFLGWYMNGLVIQSLGLTAQAQDMMVMESVQMQFISLRLFTAPFTASPFGAGIPNVAWSEL